MFEGTTTQHYREHAGQIPDARLVELRGTHGDAFEADSAAYFEAIGRFVSELDR